MTLARPMLAEVLGVLTPHSAERWDPRATRLDRVDVQGVWCVPAAWNPAIARVAVCPWAYPDPAEAWEVLQTRGLIPDDYRGRFVHREFIADSLSPESGGFSGWRGEILLHPASLPDLVAWASIGFAPSDDGSHAGILGAEEIVQRHNPDRRAVWAVGAPLVEDKYAGRRYARDLAAVGIDVFVPKVGDITLWAPPLNIPALPTSERA